MLTIPYKAFLLALTSNLLLMTSPGMVMAKSTVIKTYSKFSNDDANTVVKRVKREFECELMDANKGTSERWNASKHRIGADFFDDLYTDCYWVTGRLAKHIFHPFASPHSRLIATRKKKRAYTDKQPMTPRTKRKWECELYNDDLDRIIADVLAEIRSECDSRDSLNQVLERLRLLKEQVQESEANVNRPSSQQMEHWQRSLREDRVIISRHQRKMVDAGIIRPLLGRVLSHMDFALSTLNATAYRFEMPFYGSYYAYRHNLTSVTYRLGNASILIQAELERMKDDFFQEAEITNSTDMPIEILMGNLNEREKLISLIEPLQNLQEEILERSENRTTDLPNWRMVNDWRKQMRNPRTWINNITLTREQAGIYRPILDNAVHNLNEAISLLNYTFVIISEIRDGIQHGVYSVHRNLHSISVYLQHARAIIQREVTSMAQDHFQGAIVPDTSNSAARDLTFVLMNVTEELGTLKEQVREKAYNMDTGPPSSATYEAWRQTLRLQLSTITEQQSAWLDSWGIDRLLLGNASNFLNSALSSLNGEGQNPVQYRMLLRTVDLRLMEARNAIDKELSRMVQDHYEEVESSQVEITWQYLNLDNVTEREILQDVEEQETAVIQQMDQIRLYGNLLNRGILIDWRRQLRIDLNKVYLMMINRNEEFKRIGILYRLEPRIRNLIYAQSNMSHAIAHLYSSRQYLNDISVGRHPDPAVYRNDLTESFTMLMVSGWTLQIELEKLDEINRIKLFHVDREIREIILLIKRKVDNPRLRAPSRRQMRLWKSKMTKYGAVVHDVANELEGSLDRYGLDTASTAMGLTIPQLTVANNSLGDRGLTGYRKYLTRTMLLMNYARVWISEQVIIYVNEIASSNSSTERPPGNPRQRRRLNDMKATLRDIKERIQEISQNQSSNAPTSLMLRSWSQQIEDERQTVNGIIDDRNGTITRPFLHTVSDMLDGARRALIVARNYLESLSTGVDSSTTDFRDDLEISVLHLHSARYGIRQEVRSMRQDENNRS